MEYFFEKLLNKYKLRWYSTEVTPINRICKYSKAKDKQLCDLRKLVINLMEKIDAREIDEVSIKEILFQKVKEFMIETLEIDAWVCDELFDEAYYNSSVEFMQRARAFKTEMPFEDIFQALRNVWVINSMQIYMGVDVKLTDAVFAYSMLYPLTDNYLDDPKISKEEKQSFNKRFYNKIKNNEDSPRNAHEKDIFYMINLIEKDFPREHYKDVYKSLLGILDAQDKSLSQQDIDTLFDIDLLGYTFYKGGTSVLVDAYLVKGTLTEREAFLAYGYGVILQIADDLQDIDEDIKNNHNTMMNIQARYNQLDDIFLKYERFIELYFKECYDSITKKQEALKILLSTSVEVLVLGGIFKNKKYFSRKTRKVLLTSGYFSHKAYTKAEHMMRKKFNYRIAMIEKVEGYS